MGSSLPPFQTSMSSPFGQSGMGPTMDTQKSSGLFGVESKTTSGGSSFKTSDPFSSGGPGIHSMDYSTGINRGSVVGQAAFTQTFSYSIGRGQWADTERGHCSAEKKSTLIQLFLQSNMASSSQVPPWPITYTQACEPVPPIGLIANLLSV